MNRKFICAMLLFALLVNITSCELGKPTTADSDDSGTGSTPDSVTAYDISDPEPGSSAPTEESKSLSEMISDSDTTAADTQTLDGETTAAEDTVVPAETIAQTADIVGAASYSGTINSATCVGINVRIDWTVDIKENAQNATVSATAYFEYLNLRIKDTRTGALKIGEASAEYSTGSIQENNKIKHELKLAELTTEVPLSQGQVELSAEWNLGGNYGGVYIGNIVAKGKVMLTDDYASLPATAYIDLKNVMQTPELPNGCEITSLAATLNYLGLDVDKLTLNDKYLAIGEVYKADPSEKFVGNPRESASFGCYAPVIQKAAQSYIDANPTDGKLFKASDISGVNVGELYRYVAAGTPVIVWVTSDINTVPTIYKSWTAENGKLINWKHPSHTVVLIGYAEDSVTVADPLNGIVTLDKAAFELRYIQMDSQAVVITSTESAL